MFDASPAARKHFLLIIALLSYLGLLAYVLLHHRWIELFPVSSGNRKRKNPVYPVNPV